VYNLPQMSVNALLVRRYELAYQPMSSSEWNTFEMTGIAVATIVLSRATRSTDMQRAKEMKISLAPLGYSTSSSKSGLGCSNAVASSLGFELDDAIDLESGDALGTSFSSFSRARSETDTFSMTAALLIFSGVTTGGTAATSAGLLFLNSIVEYGIDGESRSWMDGRALRLSTADGE